MLLLHLNAPFFSTKMLDLPLKSFFSALIMLFIKTLDCEQSLFFFRFSESSARAWERRSRETRETRAAARASPFSRHQSRAWPFACLAFCSTDYRKKRDLKQSIDVRCKVYKVQARYFCFRWTAMKDRVRLTTLRTT